MMARDDEPAVVEGGTRARPADPVSDLKPGLPVYTSDNHQIGTVKEVADGSFKVDAPMRPDYWLRRDAVLSFSAERVTLDVEQDRLNDVKVAAPGH